MKHGAGGARGGNDVPPAVETATDATSAERARPVLRAPVLEAGDRVGRYQIVRSIARGGMGVVYLAYDPELNRNIALKLLLPRHRSDPRSGERLLREAQAMARLSHPNVVSIYDAGTHGENVFLAMEYVEGVTLREWLRGARRSWDEIWSVFEGAGHALAAAHAAGLVHRDFKPSNVLVDEHGRSRITDFGLARYTDETMDLSALDDPVWPSPANRLESPVTRTGAIIGTPLYMAPEQHHDQAIDARADQYAFCMALYEALYGQAPFGGDEADLVVAKAGDQVRPAPSGSNVPAFRREALLRGLRADPAARFASMSALLEVLRANPASTRRRWLALSVLAGGLVAVAVALSLWGARDDRFEKARRLSLRGDVRAAQQWLDAYLEDHPNDPDALVHAVMQRWYLTGYNTRTEDAVRRALAAPLSPGQRLAMEAMLARQDGDLEGMIKTLETMPDAERESLQVYLLGEGHWHAGRFVRGADLFEESLRRAPDLLGGLYHLEPFALARGQLDRLRAVQPLVTALDDQRGEHLAIRVEMATDPAQAVVKAERFVAAHPKSAHGWILLAQAASLADDLRRAREAAERAYELWPSFEHYEGGAITLGEQHLYAGRRQDLLALAVPLVREVMEVVWSPNPARDLPWTPPKKAVDRMPSLMVGLYLESRHIKGETTADFWSDYPEQHVRSFGAALDAELKGDRAAAIEAYRLALETPSGGDLDLLAAHHLARVAQRSGDAALASRACESVRRPRLYMSYRAVVLPDCLLWSAEAASGAPRRALLRRLVDPWVGEFEHPAVVNGRALLAKEL